ncbi:type II toxin-antitoxin system Phd/YefM family antitoxin [Nocardia seriolae]|uniref:Antitoxin n=1 Tax=Nocardia seriolae TaxID=37332 RepID=A0ABC9Z6V0_9NOCA|nr:type II toxin-antitoxin system Phd/YefM family antitoxin [Nocardia seriolae]APB00933.1 Putative antitoxin [Nocardia seriolae]QUN14810.1 type II toxin-antitoxin system Phd/YefM family antitoxin [Nocardia seriolae]WKY54090.1 type II toxin-antitoxin system Phd/YefM family antitoxin [Nocardia seriolae]WNJ60868.1 type II toxin-antitoxin system Phd/YefM family antitoxin [Nocardia seriolae]BAW09135.1 conserved hypothetical protein [Nocardia seriolae]
MTTKKTSKPAEVEKSARASFPPRLPRTLRARIVRPTLTAFGKARSTLTEQIEESAKKDVIILRNSEPAAVLIGYERYQALLDYIEDLEDRLSIVDREGDTVSFKEAAGDLDIGI